MTEEEYFRKNYPNSCYGDKPLSPHWDFFQDGVEFGERQSEKRIEELEEENKTVSRKANKAISDKLLITAKYNEVLNDLNQENDKLQKENTELKRVIDNDVDKKIYAQLAKKAQSVDLYKNNLTKAKEIIKTFLGFAEAFGYSPSMDKFISDTKQFLSEVEK